MDQLEFKQNYSKLRTKFGQNYFGDKKAVVLFQLLKVLTNDEGKAAIEDVLESIQFTIDCPPKLDAFENSIKKVQTEKKRAEDRLHKVKSATGPSWSELESMGHGGGLTNTLKQYGVDSVDDLIRNNFKPRKC